jgi:DNA-binding MarR family transcriptional regulator
LYEKYLSKLEINMSRESKRELLGELMHLARANEAANDAFDEVAAQKLGINRTDLRCLGIVENQGPMTAGRLAELSGLTTAAITSILDRLESAGYARRVRDQNDRRQVIVAVTPLLAKRGKQIWGPLGKEAGMALSRLSLDELKGTMDFFRLGIDLNKRHIERVRNLEFDD